MLTELYGRAPYYTRMGGSVPVLDAFLTTLGAYSINVGFLLEDEQFHAPNEFLRLASFERGQRAWARLLHRLGEQDAEKG